MVWEQSYIIKMRHTEIFSGVELTLPTDDIIFFYILFFLDIKGHISYDWCRKFLISMSKWHGG